MSAPKLIVVTGPDGAGKTTQVARIAELLERGGKHKVAAVTIWDMLLDPSCRGKLLLDDPKKVDSYLSILHPTSRALFLFHSFHEALVLARKRQADVLLINSYWYKYFATEVAHGGDRAVLRELARVFPAPDLTFYLKVDPEEAFGRKDKLSGYESGFAKEKTKEAFVAFQRVAHAELEQLSAELGWVPLDGRAPVAELTRVLAERIDKEV
jgi:thymidylate kinase